MVEFIVVASTGMGNLPFLPEFGFFFLLLKDPKIAFSSALDFFFFLYAHPCKSNVVYVVSFLTDCSECYRV